MSNQAVAVQAKVGAPAGSERRASVRHVCHLEALSRPTEVPDTLRWGATVKNISRGGLGLLICYPFKPGTFLAIDLQGPPAFRTLLARVVHVTDQADGAWFLGCEFAAPLADGDLQALL